MQIQRLKKVCNGILISGGSHSHPFHEMSKLWADEGRAGVARVHVQPSTLYQDDGGGDLGDGVLGLGR